MMKFFLASFSAIVIGVLPSAATIVNGAEEEAPVEVILHPASEPTPALKYRLLPGFMEQIPGNAAVHYGKVTAEEIAFFSNQQHRENYHRWLDAPLEELRRTDPHLASGGAIEASLRRGARSKFCDWQLPIRREPYFNILLPEVQQNREFGRILGARARLHMAEGEFPAAVGTLQDGYALARNMATGETIVNGLVGISISTIMNEQLIDFVQQPDAPNLYWALAALPTPLIDMRQAVEVEQHALELTFPELRDLEVAERSPDRWRTLFRRMVEETSDYIYFSDQSVPSEDDLDQRCQRALPTARRSLAENGLSSARLDAMSDYQIVLAYSVRLNRELLDHAFKYYTLAYPQSIRGIDAAIEQAQRAPRERDEVVPFSLRCLRAIRTARVATARMDRQVAVLRVFEALRMHAAANQDELPARLDDVTVVPIPDDPVTGKPFFYRRKDGTARLSGPPLPDNPLNFEIAMKSIE